MQFKDTDLDLLAASGLKHGIALLPARAFTTAPRPVQAAGWALPAWIWQSSRKPRKGCAPHWMMEALEGLSSGQSVALTAQFVESFDRVPGQGREFFLVVLAAAMRWSSMVTSATSIGFPALSATAFRATTKLLIHF